MRYQDLSIKEKTKLKEAGHKNCQYNFYGAWLDCPEDEVAFFHPLSEYRINPILCRPPKLIQGHKYWLMDRATALVTEVLRLVRAGDIDEVSIEYCDQLTAILSELEDL